MIFAATILCACSKKSTTAPTPTPVAAVSIVGKWQFVKDTATVYNNGTLLTTAPAVLDTAYYMRFNTDGSGTQVSLVGTQPFNYTLFGTSLIVNYATVVNGPVTISASTSALTVKTLTAKSLVFTSSYTTNSGVTTYVTNQVTYLKR
jgi:hypothetical protein